jgi:ketosteroid isomerase-like protein
MLLNEATAEVVLGAIHLAWSEGDIPRLLDLFTLDLVYRCNLPDDTGEPRHFEGREQFGAFLRTKRGLMKSTTVVNQFSYSSGIARANITYVQRHHTTGLEYSGSYRQLATFRGLQVTLLEEFHDVEKLRTYWKLIESESRS